MNDEEMRVVNNMEKYGGGFVKALAMCFFKADRINFAKLRVTFKGYWKEYEKIKCR